MCTQWNIDINQIELISANKFFQKGDFTIMKTKEIPVIMTFNECKDILKVGKNTLLELIHSGELSAFKIGNRWRISRDDLIDYINGL